MISCIVFTWLTSLVWSSLGPSMLLKRALFHSLHVLPIVNSAIVNIGVHVSFQSTVLSRYMPRSGIARSYGSSVFSFMRNLHTVLHCDCTSLHSHQLCRRIPFSPHPLQHLLFVDVLMSVLLTSVGWYLIILMICISPTISSVEHVFMSLWPSVCLRWRNVFHRSSAHFLTGLFGFCHWAICLFSRCNTCLFHGDVFTSDVLYSMSNTY